MSISPETESVKDLEAQLRALSDAFLALREASEAVTFYDWSDNDSDAVADMERLRTVVIDTAQSSLAIRKGIEQDGYNAGVEDAALIADAYKGVHQCISDEIRALKATP